MYPPKGPAHESGPLNYTFSVSAGLSAPPESGQEGTLIVVNVEKAKSLKSLNSLYKFISKRSHIKISKIEIYQIH